MRNRSKLSKLSMVLLAIGALLSASTSAGADTSTTPDPSSNQVGRDPSIALDAAGNPVVSYHDNTDGDLKILHCDDPNCADGGESITVPDSFPDIGDDSSLVLDSSGHPVVAYFGDTNNELLILRCDDPNCAGGGESIESQGLASVGQQLSLALDAAGNPVVAFHLSNDLAVLHCDDPNCAGGDSLTTPDTAGVTGLQPSLVLDAAGNPVVAYYDVSSGTVDILHCDDPDCDGVGESITSPDSPGVSFSIVPSLALDAAGYPVVAYYSPILA